MERSLLSMTKDREGSRRAARIVVAAVALCALTLAPALGIAAPPVTTPSPQASPAVVWVHRASGTTKALAAVAFANGRFVAVGYAGTILLSEDGLTWTSASSGTSASLDGVAFGGKFVAVGFNRGTLVSEILTSDDGKGWSEVISPLLTRVFLKAVTYGSGKFVVVGTNGSILVSANGITWTRSVSGTVAALNAVAYGGDRFVAVGEGGVIATSSDGISWTSEDSGTLGSLHGVAYGGGRFVAVGPTGSVTSADGVHWSPSGTGMSGAYAVAYGEGQFVAVGDRGSVNASADGSTWVPGPNAVATPTAALLLSGIAYGSGQFVTIAGSGEIWSISATRITARPAPSVTVQAIAATTPPTPPVTAPAPAATAPVPAPTAPQAPASTAPTTGTGQGAGPASPAVVSITPSTGPSAGGTTITIAGSGLAGATQVTLQPTDSGTGQNGLDCNASALQAAKIVSVSDSQIVALTPAVGTPAANLCTEDVVVTTPAGSSSLVWQDRFLYLATAPKAPTVASISPQNGPASGGTRVTITGSSFAGATGVSFGGVPAAFSIKSDSTIVAFAPPAPSAAGTVDVTVTASPLASQANHAAQFAYDTSGQVYLPGSGWSTPQKRFSDLAAYPWAAAAIDALAARGIVQGVAPGRFAPSAPVTRAQFAAMAQRFFQLPEPRQPIAFTDVRPGDWDHAAVQALAAYIGASSPRVFAPGETATRQDVAAAIVRILAARGSVRLLDAAEAQAGLGRITDKADIAPRLRVYAATAIRERIMLGFPDGSFKPMAPLTRAQAAVLLYNVQTHFLQTTLSSAPR